MCQGKDKLNYYMKDYKRRSDSLSNKEQDVLKDMKIVQEMYARGYEFLPLDIYKAKATKFQIIDGKLMPPLSVSKGWEKRRQRLWRRLQKTDRICLWMISDSEQR